MIIVLLLVINPPLSILTIQSTQFFLLIMMRILQEKQEQDEQWTQIIKILFIVLGILAGLACLVIIIVKYISNNRRRLLQQDLNQNPPRRKRKSKNNQIPNMEIFFPSIPYKLYLQKVVDYIKDSMMKQHQSQEVCCVCLLQFIEQNQEQNHQNLNEIKITVCNHIFHSKCLQEWLKRQLSCPICRQSLNSQSLVFWELKFGFDFESVNKQIIEKKNDSKKMILNSKQPPKRLQFKIQLTLQSLKDFDIAENSQKIDSKKQQLDQFQNSKQTLPFIYAIILYRKICSYHMMKKMVRQQQQHREMHLVIQNQFVGDEGNNINSKLPQDLQQSFKRSKTLKRYDISIIQQYQE